jgi:hypothetical protein
MSDTYSRDVAPIAADTIIDCGARQGAAPALVSSRPLRLPKARGAPSGPGYVVLSFVIDTAGFVIRNSVRIETVSPREFGGAFLDWLRDAQFEPVRRGGRPVRAAFRNMAGVFQLAR